MDWFSGFITRVIDWFYIKPIQKIIPRQTFRYAAIGAVNLGVGWVLFYIFQHYIIPPHDIDLGFIVVAPYTATLYATAPFIFLLGFYFNRNVTFTKSPLRGRTQFFRYLFSSIIALLLDHLLLKLFVEGLGFWGTPAQMTATIVIAFGFSYPAQKYFTFRGCDD